MELEVIINNQTKTLNDLLFHDHYTLREIHQSSTVQVFGAITDKRGHLINKNTYVAYQGPNNQVMIFSKPQFIYYGAWP